MKKLGFGCVVLSLLMVPTSAHAYIDPGLGSILIQSLIGTLALIAGGISMYFGRVKAFFIGIRDKDRQQKKR